MIDTHAHIYSSKFDEDRTQMLEVAFSEGVSKIFMPNIDHTSIEGMMELEAQYQGTCYAMMGLHPCSVGKDFEKELYLVEDWLSKREFIAVGEMGLDLYWDKTFIEQQKEAFRIQANWAKEYEIPLVIHSREAMTETIELLEELADDKLFGVLHCFAGTAEEAKRLKALQFKIGLGGSITYKNGGMDKVVPEIDLSEIVLETDSPYLPPVPNRGKRNEPSFLKYVADKISDYKEVATEEVIRRTTENALALFAKAK